MNACPIFSRLATDMTRLGLADDEQRAGETLATAQSPIRPMTNEASPISHLPGHAGQEL